MALAASLLRADIDPQHDISEADDEEIAQVRAESMSISYAASGTVEV